MTEWKKNAVHPLRIEGYTAEGMGVARLEGRVVFVPFTAQGELWRVRLEKVRPNMAWGRGVELLESSPERAQADCPLFGRCGGCQFRHLTYAEELRAKGQRIADALDRVGGVRLDLPPLLGAESPDRYRNKVQFPVAPGRRGPAVGYYRPRSHDVLDVADCLLQPETVTALRLAFLGWMEDFHVPPYEETSRSGLIRHLYVRTNRAGEACAVWWPMEAPSPIPRSWSGGCARLSRAGRGGAQPKHPGHQCDPGAGLPHPLGAGFSGGDPVRHDLPPVCPLLLPDQPGPD